MTNIVDIKQLSPITNKGGEIFVPISPQNCDSKNLIMGKVILKAYEELLPHMHDYSDEAFLVVKGRGTLKIESKILPLENNKAYFIPKGQIHQITNDKDCDLELIFSSAPLAPHPSEGDKIVV